MSAHWGQESLNQPETFVVTYRRLDKDEVNFVAETFSSQDEAVMRAERLYYTKTDVGNVDVECMSGPRMGQVVFSLDVDGPRERSQSRVPVGFQVVFSNDEGRWTVDDLWHDREDAIAAALNLRYNQPEANGVEVQVINGSGEPRTVWTFPSTYGNSEAVGS